MSIIHPDQRIPARGRVAGGGQPGTRTGRRTVRRVAVVAASFVALTGATSYSAAMAAPGHGSVQATPPKSPAWHIVKQVHSGPFGDFTALVAVGKNGGWAFNQGSKPTAWQRSGSSWTQVAFPGHANEVVETAGATSATNVWAFTADGTHSRALHWNGHSWTVQHTFAQQVGGAVVLSPTDVWVFGEPYFPGPVLGAWHYNGHTWSAVASGRGLEGGSALSARDIWAFTSTDIAHWNGSTWSRISVARFLPPKNKDLNDPMVTGVFVQSKDSVYAVANGDEQDEGGPMVLLHWNGSRWSKVAEANLGYGTQPLQQASSDGHGGLLLPMPGADGFQSYLLHYRPGHGLSEASLPGGPSRTSVDAVTQIPGTGDLLAAGETHASNKPGTNVVAVLLQYGS